MNNLNRREKGGVFVKNSFLRGAAVLGIGGVLVKLLGVLYRIPLTNIIGAEGIGLYQMVFPFYTLLLTVSSSGLPTAISKMVAERRARGEYAEAKRVFYASIKSLAVLGAAASLLVVLLHRVVAAVQGNPSAAPAYLGIAPSLFLVALISAFRGYFQGRQSMLPTAVSQITEQVVKIVAGLGLAYVLLPYGAEYAALGALLGVSISELAALIQLFIQYLFVRKKHDAELADGERIGRVFDAMDDLAVRNAAYNFEAGELTTVTVPDAGARTAARGRGRRGKMRRNTPEHAVKRQARADERQLVKSIYRIALPVTLGAIILPATQLIDSVLVINLLKWAGYSVRNATVLYGIMTGPVMSIINMPVVLSLAVATSAVPSVAALRAVDGGRREVGKKSREALGLALLIAVPGALAVGFGADLVIRILYGAGLKAAGGIDEQLIARQLLSLTAVSILFIALMQVSTALLQASGRPYVPVRNLAIGAAVKIIVSFILIPNPHIHIYGAAIGTVLCYAVAAVLDLISARGLIRLNQ